MYTINKKLIKQEISEIKRVDNSNQYNNHFNNEFEKVNLFGFGLRLLIFFCENQEIYVIPFLQQQVLIIFFPV